MHGSRYQPCMVPCAPKVSDWKNSGRDVVTTFKIMIFFISLNYFSLALSMHPNKIVLLMITATQVSIQFKGEK